MNGSNGMSTITLKFTECADGISRSNAFKLYCGKDGQWNTIENGGNK